MRGWQLRYRTRAMPNVLCRLKEKSLTVLRVLFTSDA